MSGWPKRLIIEVFGETEGDLEDGLAEAVRRIEDGNVCGYDRNETGNFMFDIQ